MENLYRMDALVVSCLIVTKKLIKVWENVNVLPLYPSMAKLATQHVGVLPVFHAIQIQINVFARAGK